MPLIEIDDATAAAMSQNGIKFQDRTVAFAQSAKTMAELQKIQNGPRRSKWLELVKEEYPDLPIPEIDAAKPAYDRIAAMEKKQDEFIEALKKKDEERETKDREMRATKTVEQGRSWLRRDKKLDDEGVKSVERIMQDEEIPSYQAAFLLWRDRNPPTETDLPAIRGGNLDWFKAETEDSAADMKLRLSDPLKYRQKRIPQMLQQLRRGEIDEFGRSLKPAA